MIKKELRDNYFNKMKYVDFKLFVPMCDRLKGGKFPCVFSSEFMFRKEMLILLTSSMVIKHLLKGFDKLYER